MILQLYYVLEVESILEEIHRTESLRNAGVNDRSNLFILLSELNEELSKLISMVSRTLITTSPLKFSEPILSTEKESASNNWTCTTRQQGPALNLRRLRKIVINHDLLLQPRFVACACTEKARGWNKAGDGYGSNSVAVEWYHRGIACNEGGNKSAEKTSELFQDKRAITDALKAINFLKKTLADAGTWIAHSRTKHSEVKLKYFLQPKQNGPYLEEACFPMGKHYDLSWTIFVVA